MTAKAKLADIKIVQVQLASLPERVWFFLKQVQLTTIQKLRVWLDLRFSICNKHHESECLFS